MKTRVFDLATYLRKEMVLALTCPINRHGTRVANSCDDEYLARHPNLLVEHFAIHGGSAEFSRHRDEFFREFEIPDVPEYEL